MCRLASASFVFLFVSAAWSQQGRPREEMYSAIATGWAAGSKAVLFDCRITHFAGEAEMNRYTRLLNERGPSALRMELEKDDAGRIERVGETQNRIGIAKKVTMGPDTVITLITARNMPFPELYGLGSRTEYPFGVLQVTVTESDIGSGRILVAAKLHFDDKKGHCGIESYNWYYINAVNVRLTTGRSSHPLRGTRSGYKLAASFTRNEQGRIEARRKP